MQFAIDALHAVFVLYYELAFFAEGSSEWRNLYVTSSYSYRAHPTPLRGDGARCAGAAGSPKTGRHPISGAGFCLVWGENPVHARRFVARSLPGGNIPRFIV